MDGLHNNTQENNGLPAIAGNGEGHGYIIIPWRHAHMQSGFSTYVPEKETAF